MLLPFVSVRNLQYNTVPDGYLFTRPSTQTHLGDKFASRTIQPLYDREPPSHNEQEGGKYVVQGPTHRIAKQLKGHPYGPKNLRQVHSSSHVTPSRGCQRGKPADERRRRAGTSRSPSGGAEVPRGKRKVACVVVSLPVPESQACAYLAVCVPPVPPNDRQTASFSVRGSSVCEVLWWDGGRVRWMVFEKG